MEDVSDESKVDHGSKGKLQLRVRPFGLARLMLRADTNAAGDKGGNREGASV